MIEIDQKNIGITASGESTYIILHQKSMEVCVPGYKGGKPVSVEYPSVKSIKTIDGDILVAKIFRTEVTLGDFGTGIATKLCALIEEAKNCDLSKTKTYKKLQKQEEKEERRAERQEIREDRKDKRAEKWNDAKVAMARSVSKAFCEDADERRQRQRTDRLYELKVDIDDSKEDTFAKLGKLISFCDRLVNEEEEELIDKCVPIIEDSLEIAEERFPESEEILLVKKRFTKLNNRVNKYKTQEKRKTIIGAIICVVGLAAYFLWEYLKK